MIKQGINYLTYFALFLPFSCNERRQLGTIQCKAESLELVEKMMKTAPYGYFAKACKSLQSELPKVRDQEAGGSNPLAPTNSPKLPRYV